MTNAHRFAPIMGSMTLLALLLLPVSAAHAGGIAGTIRDAVTGQVIGRVDLDVFNASFDQVFGIDDPGAPTNDQTASDGTYVLEPLAPGSYYLRADPSLAQGYVTQHFPEVFLRSQATPVRVRATGLTTVDFYLQRGHFLQGRVVDVVTNEPLAGIDLDVFGSDGSFIDWMNAVTDANGNFSIGLVPDGTYHLRTEALGVSMYLSEFYGGASNFAASHSIAVHGANVTGLTFKLDLGGSVSGVVTDRVTGAPISGCDIDIFDGAGQLLPDANGSTDANGVYRVGSLPDGNYFVRADATAEQGYIDTYYGDAISLGSAVLVAISAGTTASGTSLSMPRGGTIAGVVTSAATGEPLPNVQITVWSGMTRVDFAYTGPDGSYLIGAMPNGDYKVRCAGVPELGLAFQFHTGAIVASQAAPVAVSSGTTVGGVHFALQSGGWISGRVATKRGEPLADVSVDLFLPSGEVLPSMDTATESDGTYIVGPIPSGTFVLRTNPSNSYPQFSKRYYGGTELLPTAQPLTVVPGATLSDVDFLFGDIDLAVRPRPSPQISAYPNPFNPRTRLAFNLDASGPVKVTIHDVRGRIIAVLADGVMAAGRHEFVWDGEGVLGQGTSSGVHFVRVETAAKIEKQKLVLLK